MDNATFETLYLAHFGLVLRFVVRRVADAETAADLTAEVFVVAWRSWSTYRGDGPPGAWLLGIARRVVAAELDREIRDQQSRRLVAGRRLLDVDDADRMAERLDAERDAREVYRRLDELPANQRAVVELVAVDGLTVTEAAEVLGIQPVTARVRWFRARRALREILQSYAESDIERRSMEVTR